MAVILRLDPPSRIHPEPPQQTLEESIDGVISDNDNSSLSDSDFASSMASSDLASPSLPPLASVHSRRASSWPKPPSKSPLSSTEATVLRPLTSFQISYSVQVCRHRNDAYAKSVVMVLMMSIKHACKLGWFTESEGQQLIALADEMKISYGAPGNTSPAIESPGGTLSQIRERFYPFVKLGHVLVSLEVKAGYTMLAHDFHISKNMPDSPQESIQLFVVQTENIDTSVCIINPPEVRFSKQLQLV